jgi:ankyrin repeat protein
MRVMFWLIAGSVAAAQPVDSSTHPIFAALQARDYAALERAIGPADDLNALVNRRRESPLLLACTMRDADAVKLLLSKGASPNPTGLQPGVRNPLSAALLERDPQVTRLLLAAGAELASRNAVGTPFDIVFHTGDNATAQLVYDAMMVDRRADAQVKGDTIRLLDQALCAAARRGRLDWIRRLLDDGASVNAIEMQMYTPLMCAVISRDQESVELILQRGGYPHIALGQSRTTALHYAVAGKAGPAIVRRLLETYAPHAPELNDATSLNESILYKAVLAGDVPVLQLLIDHGANPHAVAGTSDLLTTAIVQGNLGMVEALLRAGVLVGHIARGEASSPTHLDVARDHAKQQPSPERQQILELVERSMATRGP